MITVYDFEQRSAEWEDARRGMVTASMVGKLISIGPPEPTATGCPTCGAEASAPCVSVARKAPTAIKSCHESRALAAATLPPVYRPATTEAAKVLTTALVAERINGWSEPVNVTNDMLRGVLGEPLAREVYRQHYGDVREVGLIVRDDRGFSIGYSPDGLLVGDDGLIEIKSRRARIQLATVLADEVPAENMAQIQCGLLVTGRAWCDYLSYCGGMAMWTKRVYPDPAWQAAIIAAVEATEQTIAEMVATYKKAVEGLPATERIDYNQEMVV